MEAEATQVTAMITNLRKNWVRLESLDNSTVGVTEEDFNRFKKILSEGGLTKIRKAIYEERVLRE